MEIWDSILRKNKQETVNNSLLWNSIIIIFNEQKWIDITPYLESIKLNWNRVFIKTNNPLINTELLLIDDKIKKLFSEKLKKVWIKFYDFEVKYI